MAVSRPVSASVTSQSSVEVAVVEPRRPAAVEVQREVAALLVVAQEVLLDLPALVAQAQDEAAHPVRAVDLHDVPEDRLLADLDHRLGAVLGLLAQARAHAAAEDDDGKVAGRGLVGHWRAIVAPRG